MVKVKKIILFVLLFSISMLSSCVDRSVQKDFLIVGTGSMMGIYYPIGSSICKLTMDISNSQRKIVCSVASTPGSVYNLNSMRNGNIDVGIVQYDWAYNAYNGLSIFQDTTPMRNLRLLANLHREYLTILTKKNSNIRSVSDLKGKRVNIGAPGTGVRGVMAKIMEIKGWTKDDFSVASELKASEQAQALCDNKIDVIAEFTGHPSALVQEAMFSCGAVFVKIDNDIREKLHIKYPYYESDVIKSGLYKGVLNDIETVSVKSVLVTTSELRDDLAYRIVKSIFNHNFGKFNIIKEQFNSDVYLKDDLVPLHDAAKVYYSEIGLMN